MYYADSVKRDARKIFAAVKEKGCAACPSYDMEHFNGDCQRNCRLEILRTLQRAYDFKVDLQQNFFMN